MNKFLAVYILIGSISFADNAVARTYYLPDYQEGLPTYNRINDNNGNSAGISCSTYGYYSAADRPSGTECSRATVSDPGLECYDCSICSASFAYDSCKNTYEMDPILIDTMQDLVNAVETVLTAKVDPCPVQSRLTQA